LPPFYVRRHPRRLHGGTTAGDSDSVLSASLRCWHAGCSGNGKAAQFIQSMSDTGGAAERLSTPAAVPLFFFAQLPIPSEVSNESLMIPLNIRSCL